MSAAELDCLTCGACCRSGHDGRILIPPEDLVRWRTTGRHDIAAAIRDNQVVIVSGETGSGLRIAIPRTASEVSSRLPSARGLMKICDTMVCLAASAASTRCW